MSVALAVLRASASSGGQVQTLDIECKPGYRELGRQGLAFAVSDLDVGRESITQAGSLGIRSHWKARVVWLQ